MGNFKLIWNPLPIINNVEEAFAETVELLGLEFTKAITSNIWPWIDGSNRDIVDKGQLRDSQSHRFINKVTAEFNWAVSYAAAVHQGAVLKNGTKMPARPWTTYAMNNFNFMDVFTKIYRSKQ